MSMGISPDGIDRGGLGGIEGGAVRGGRNTEKGVN